MAFYVGSGILRLGRSLTHLVPCTWVIDHFHGFVSRHQFAQFLECKNLSFSLPLLESSKQNDTSTTCAYSNLSHWFATMVVVVVSCPLRSLRVLRGCHFTMISIGPSPSPIHIYARRCSLLCATAIDIAQRIPKYMYVHTGSFLWCFTVTVDGDHRYGYFSTIV